MHTWIIWKWSQEWAHRFVRVCNIVGRAGDAMTRRPGEVLFLFVYNGVQAAAWSYMFVMAAVSGRVYDATHTTLEWMTLLAGIDVCNTATWAKD